MAERDIREVREKRDLVLPEGTYAFMQDVTKGTIKCYSGPTVINPTAQEVPVRWNTKSHTFDRVELEQALCMSPVAVEGFYMELLNPAPTDKGLRGNNLNLVSRE